MKHSIVFKIDFSLSNSYLSFGMEGQRKKSGKREIFQKKWGKSY